MAHAYHPSASEGKAGEQELKVILSHITGSRTACTTWVSPLTVTTTVTENKNYNVSSSVCLAFLTIYNIQKHVYMLQGLKASKESLRVNSGFKPLEEKPTLRDFIDFIEEVWKTTKHFVQKWQRNTLFSPFLATIHSLTWQVWSTHTALLQCLASSCHHQAHVVKRGSGLAATGPDGLSLSFNLATTLKLFKLKMRSHLGCG